MGELSRIGDKDPRALREDRGDHDASVGDHHHAAGRQGTLRLNVSQWAATVVLARRLGQFAQTYPDIRLEIVVDNGWVDIVREGFDAGIRMGERLEKDMSAVALTADLRVAVVASPSYWADRSRPQRPEDLQHHRCISRRHTARGALHRWEFEKGGKKVVLQPEGPLTVSTEDLVMAAALDGVGVAYLAEIDAIEHLRSGRLVRVLEAWRPPGPGLFLYLPQSRQGTPTLRALIEVITAPPLPGSPSA